MSDDQEPEFASTLLRQEWRDNRDVQKAERALADMQDSGEMSTNMRLVERGLARMPEAERERLETRTDKNGRRLLNDPKVIRSLVAQERQSPPSLVEAARELGVDERAAIESMMADRSSPYWKSADAERLQARYRDLTREVLQVKDQLGTQYAANAKALDADLALIREHMSEPDFEKNEIAKLREKGFSPIKASAIAEFFRYKLK